jgi:hypothetical protein
VISTIFEVPHCAVFTTLLLLGRITRYFTDTFFNKDIKLDYSIGSSLFNTILSTTVVSPFA